MKKQDFETKLEQGLISAFDEMAPDPFDSIKARITEQEDSARPDSQNDTFREIIRFNDRARKSSKRIFKALSAVAAMICICLLPFLLTGNVAGTIYIDVNPSISIAYDKKGEVTSIQAENDDGQNILNAFSITETAVSPAIGQIFDQLDSNGYFTDQKVNMIITNCGAKKGKTAVSENDIDQIVDTYLDAKDLDATWVYQSFTENKDLSETAGERHLSVGKLYFLNHAAENPDVNNEALEQENVTTIFETLKKDHISLDTDKYCKVRTRNKKHAKSSGQNTPASASPDISSDTAETAETSLAADPGDTADTSSEESVTADDSDTSDHDSSSSVPESAEQSNSNSLTVTKENDSSSVNKENDTASSDSEKSAGSSSSANEKKTGNNTASGKKKAGSSSSSDKKSADSNSSSKKKSADSSSPSKKKSAGSSSPSDKKSTDSSSSSKKKSTGSSSSSKKKSTGSSSSSKKKSTGSSSPSKKNSAGSSSSSKKKSTGSSSSSKKKSAESSSSSKKKSAESSSSSGKKSAKNSDSSEKNKKTSKQAEK